MHSISNRNTSLKSKIEMHHERTPVYHCSFKTTFFLLSIFKRKSVYHISNTALSVPYPHVKICAVNANNFSL